MIDINSVTVSGRTTEAIDLRQTGNGTPVANFQIANNRVKKQNNEWKEETAYITIQAWGKNAEFVAQQPKGTLIIVAGYLRQERWEQDGKTRSKLVVSANELVVSPRAKTNENTQEEYENGF